MAVTQTVKFLQQEKWAPGLQEEEVHLPRSESKFQEKVEPQIQTLESPVAIAGDCQLHRQASMKTQRKVYNPKSSFIKTCPSQEVRLRTN